MGTYTTEMRTIVGSGYPLFDFDYPIWDEAYRSVLNEKILRRYYFREIGLETVAMFKFYLSERLNSIMPKYNEMYAAKVEYLKQNAYTNKDIRTTRLQITDVESEREVDSNESLNGSQSLNETSTTDGKDVFHDTPMSEIGVPDPSHASRIEVKDESVQNGSTGTQNNTAIGNVKNEEVIKTVDDYLEHISGFDGMKYAFEVYQGVRENIVTIDNLILNDLKDLFMGVY